MRTNVIGPIRRAYVPPPPHTLYAAGGIKSEMSGDPARGMHYRAVEVEAGGRV